MQIKELDRDLTEKIFLKIISSFSAEVGYYNNVIV